MLDYKKLLTLEDRAVINAKLDKHMQLMELLAMSPEEMDAYGTKPIPEKELPPLFFMEDTVKTPFGYARRCTAKSKRSQERCRGIAMKGKTKCAAHGGKSCGARTQAGKERIAAAMRKSGGESRVEREKHRAHMRWFHELDRLCRQLGIMQPMPRRNRQCDRSGRFHSPL